MKKFSRMSLLLVVCVVTLLNVGHGLVKSESTLAAKGNYCPYFKNRAPEPRPNLKNCTWYKQKACCLQSELDLLFPSVLPPLGATAKCLRYTNFLMCYICAPDQNLFYENERPTVCEGFCDKWFAACGEAKLKGIKIKDLFVSGKEFCLARKFNVRSAGDGGCFTFEREITSSSLANWPSFPLLCFAGISMVLMNNFPSGH